MRILLYSLLTLSCFGANFSGASRPGVMAFEARDRQYVSHGPGYSLSVTSRAAVLSVRGHVLRISVAGANPESSLEALDRMPGKGNYLLGGDVRASYDLFGRVRSHSVYAGIDLLFRGNQEHLEYDFEIAAGRDPRKIKLTFEGADEIRIDRNGALILRTGAFEIRQPVPFAYQFADGRKNTVRVAYELDAFHHVGFRVGAYDRSKRLVIDPQLVFDSFFGGNGSSSAAGVALDGQGNIYAAGQTNSADYPLQNAAQNHAGSAPLLASGDGGQTWTTPALGAAGFVRSIASAPTTPSVLYAGTNAGVIKSADGGTTWTLPANSGLTAPPLWVAVDAGSASTVYAATVNQGVFASTNGGASWSVSTTGLLVQNQIPPGPPQLMGIAANPGQAGTVFAIAQSPDFVYRSTDFGRTWMQLTLPVAGGSPEAVAFSATDANTLFLGQRTGAFLKSTDGGNTWTSVANEQVSNPQGLTILPGNAPIILAAGENNLRRSSDGGVTWTTVLALRSGSVAADPRNAGVAYAVDASGLYRSADLGQTWTKAALPYEVPPVALFVSPADSRVFAGQNAQRDVFITKWSPDGNKILYSTYLGGSGTDSATGLAVDGTGSVYVTGTTDSKDFSVSKNAFQKTLAGPGSANAFVSKLSPDGSQLVYSTLLGGGSEVTSRIAVNGAGEAVIAGGTNSASFPVTPGAFQSAPVGACAIQSPFVQTSGTAFVSKIAADGGSLVFSTLLGGSCGTRAQAVSFDANGNAWVGGWTDSPDFPVTKDALQPALGGNVYDGFLVRFSPSGGLAYATYVGGPGYDTVSGVTFDSKGNVYLTGTSGGLSQPSSPGAFGARVTVSCVIFSFGPAVYQATGSGFVLKLDPAAHTTLGLTYLGSPLCLFPSDIAVDASGEPWIAGPLSVFGSAPQTASPFQIGLGSGFVSKFSADFTQLLFSTYFDSVSGIALDSAGRAYVAGAGPVNNAVGTGQAYIARIDSTPVTISLDSVQNAVNPASPSSAQGIGAGELLRILGKNMGPAATTGGVINAGVLATTVAGVQVTFDGAAVPLLSVSAGEIDLVAPFELAGKTATTIQVRFDGVASNPVRVGVAGPVNFVGVVSGIPLQVLGVFNADFTANSASNPAPAGSVMTLYVSGAGQTVPPSVNGQVNAFPLPAAPGPVQIQFNGLNPDNSSALAVTFAGAAPGQAAGIFQINFVAPQSSLMTLSLFVGQAGARFDAFVR